MSTFRVRRRCLLTAAICVASGLMLVGAGRASAAEDTHRLYDSLVAFVDNPEGRAFTVTLDVRDINHLSRAPAELLVKVYDPEGRPVVREVVPDDGVVGSDYAPPVAGWDHEAWYYATCYSRGIEPAVRWSAFSEPARLAAVPKRTFTYRIDAGRKGVYRVLLAGGPDHYVTLTLDPPLASGVMGSTDWLHGHGDMYRKSFLYVPKTAKTVLLMFLQLDQPCTRSFALRNAAGEVLASGSAEDGLARAQVQFAQPGQYDDQVLTLDVSEGKGDFLVCATFHLDAGQRPWRGEFAVNALFAPDEATAKALRGGAIYHDGKVFWQMYQVRYHEWLKTLKAEDTVLPEGLPQTPGYVSVGSHNAPKEGSADRIMHSYAAHKNPMALNAALKEMQVGLNLIGPCDHVAIGPLHNLAYEMGCYSFFYHRPVWRILQQTDAPEEAKGPIREFVIEVGDRLAFCRTGELINGNALGSLVAALRYCCEASGDAMQKDLFGTYWQRFTTGGFGERVGIGPSGGLQESFGYDYHYGSYVLRGWRAINQDLNDERLVKVYDRMLDLYSYVYAQGLVATPWNSRTAQALAGGTYDPWDQKHRWKGVGGPDLTEGVNGHNEWFAARRRDYYILTYHGRLTPTWLGEGFHGQVGFGGGCICQLHVPNKGQVIASSLNEAYGNGMHPSNWRNFHIHSVVGQTADGKPLVAANSEHWDAKLDGNVLTSSGEVRESSVRAFRKYVFGPDGIECSVQLKESAADNVFALWGGRHGLRGVVTEAYEMIPFAGGPVVDGRSRGKDKIRVSAIARDGKEVGELAEQPVQAVAVLLHRDGYGVRIDFGEERAVQLGKRDTVLVRLVDKQTPAGEVGITYRLVPYVGEALVQGAGVEPEAAKIIVLTENEQLWDAVAALPAHIVKADDKQLAELRLALVGENLALLANVTDSRVMQAAEAWRGSCVEVFGSMPGTQTIGQVFMVPQVGDAAAKGFRAANGIVPAEDIRVESQATKAGYVLKAFIPLKLLKVELAKGKFLLEFQMTVDATADGKKARRGTLFGSRFAYENNQRYGIFQRQEEK